ncbi:hypothetical protein [Tuwongella immobilis]|uniref:hypothetical protein n=1 Tax=Tuwongella immobilis TaxID=692036 RepID=UPI001E64949C|nr:hypothetical protein [Tuwongella immobilis]
MKAKWRGWSDLSSEFVGKITETNRASNPQKSLGCFHVISRSMKCLSRFQLKARSLTPGHRLRTLDGSAIAVESVAETGQWQSVFNLRRNVRKRIQNGFVSTSREKQFDG